MEESFPRGKEGLTQSSTRKKEDDLFKSSPKSTTSSKKRKNVLTGDEEQLLAGKKKRAERNFDLHHLSFDSLCEGMLTLGRVFMVRQHELLVSLPGRTVGSVSIKAVSRPYTRALELLAESKFPTDEVIHSLKGMFRDGDLIIVKVTGVSAGDKGHRISLSTDPAHVQANWNATLLKSGLVLTGAVESREEHGYVMDLGMNGVKAFLPHDRSHAFIKNVNETEPLGIGQLIQVKIVSCKIHRLMATVTVTAIPKHVGSVKIDDDMELNYNTLLPGMHVDGIVMETHKTGMQVHCLGLKGLIHSDHLDDAWSTPSKFEVGSSLTGRILYIEPNGTSPYLSLQPNLWPYGPFRQTKKDSSITPGSLEKVRISRFEKRGLIIRFENGQKGIVTAQRCSDDSSWTEDDISKHFPTGTFHDCRVMEFSPMDNIYICSFQRSLITEELIKIDQVTVGQKVDCKIISWRNGGAMVEFGYKLKGFVPSLHFPDVSIKKLEEKYPVGTQIKARVFMIDAEKSQTLLTVKKKLVHSEGNVLSKYEEVQVGMKGHGVIRKVLPKGLQVSAIGGLLGFLPASKISKENMGNLEAIFRRGQTIQFKVIEINAESKTMILSLNLDSREEEAEIKTEDAPIEAETSSKAKNKNKKVKTIAALNEDQAPSTKPRKVLEEKVLGKEGITLGEEPVVSKKAKGVAKEEGTSMEKKKEKSAEEKLKRKEKKMQKKEEKMKKKEKIEKKKELKEDASKVLTSTQSSFWQVAEMSQDKMELREEDVPQEVSHNSKQIIKSEEITAEEHESRVAKLPNESALWIDYMTFALESEDVNKAREIGHRAIKLMGFREEKSKLKLWTALLNLECKFGSEESVKKVLDDAVRGNDKFSVLKQMALIYDRADKFQEAEKIYKQLIKAFRNVPEAWLRFGVFYFHHGKEVEGREVFRRALEAFPATEHILLITKFAGLELEYGDRERGRSMLDQTVKAHPKRTDLWLLFANCLIKEKDIDEARTVLSRGLETKLHPRKMKPLLKRFLDLELDHGTPETLAKFKEQAVDYLGKVELSISP